MGTNGESVVAVDQTIETTGSLGISAMKSDLTSPSNWSWGSR